MKAIIPVAGAGTRLRPLTYTQPKPLIPVAGKAIISFIIDDLRKEGVDEFIFVIGHLGEKVKTYLEKHYPDMKMSFIVQNERRGLGHAIWLSQDLFKEEEQIIIFLGDTILDVDLKTLLSSPYSTLIVKKVQDPREFGVVEVDDDGFATKVVEKPMIPRSNLAIVGLYKIKEVKSFIVALNALIENNQKTYNEFQLTDALEQMIENGIKFNTMYVNNWFDCGKKEVLLDTNSILLEKEDYTPNIASHPIDSIILHPVSIGENCKISNSIIGPHVTIGDNARINTSIIKESIIGNDAKLEEVVLFRSIIGNDTGVRGLRQSLNIGDNTEIDFGTH
ncbi:MAG: NTP transferase domain-containing protein [Saprospiraceae bacterium]|jgi:glucose-1-phosphate thymidylyltransferase|nr:NTP transferase domain-containing protein [Saprospiraceae bacterium]